MRWFKGWRLVVIVIVAVAGFAAYVINDAWTAFGQSPSGERLARIMTSPNYSAGKFQNPVPTNNLKPGSTWTSIKRQFLGDEVRTPPGPLPLVRIDKSSFAEPPSSARARWLGHATVLLEIDGLRLLFDPLFSERISFLSWLGPKRFHPLPIALAELPSIDAVIISHDHYDHLDMAAVKALARRGSRFFVPLGVGAHLRLWQVPATQITELDWWQAGKIGALEITAAPARHYSGRLYFINADQTLWASWAVRGARARVFYSGDTGFLAGFAQVGERLGPFDLTLIKIGAYGETWLDIHMAPEKAVEVHRLVKGRVMLPLHWGSFNLAWHDWDAPIKRALAAAERHGVTLATPKIGQAVVIGEAVPQEHWWEQVR